MTPDDVQNEMNAMVGLYEEMAVMWDLEVSRRENTWQINAGVEVNKRENTSSFLKYLSQLMFMKPEGRRFKYICATVKLKS